MMTLEQLQEFLQEHIRDQEEVMNIPCSQGDTLWELCKDIPTPVPCGSDLAT
jgi:hypothetical protein